jgi:hypothetical protein
MWSALVEEEGGGINIDANAMLVANTSIPDSDVVGSG